MTIRDVRNGIEYAEGDAIPLEPDGLYEVAVCGAELLHLLGTNLEEQLALAGSPVEFATEWGGPNEAAVELREVPEETIW